MEELDEIKKTINDLCSKLLGNDLKPDELVCWISSYNKLDIQLRTLKMILDCKVLDQS